MVRTPLVKARSLMENGMPWSGPRAPPFVTAASASRAESMAASASKVQKAFTLGFRRSMRSSTARVSSTGDSVLARIISARRVAGV